MWTPSTYTEHYVMYNYTAGDPLGGTKVLSLCAFKQAACTKDLLLPMQSCDHENECTSVEVYTSDEAAHRTHIKAHIKRGTKEALDYD